MNLIKSNLPTSLDEVIVKTTTTTDVNINASQINNSNSLIVTPTDILKENNSVVKKKDEKKNKIDIATDLSNKDMCKMDTSPAPNFGNNLTITAIGSFDVASSKPLPSVQNQVIYFFLHLLICFRLVFVSYVCIIIMLNMICLLCV